MTSCSLSHSFSLQRKKTKKVKQNKSKAREKQKTENPKCATGKGLFDWLLVRVSRSPCGSVYNTRVVHGDALLLYIYIYHRTASSFSCLYISLSYFFLRMYVCRRIHLHVRVCIYIYKYIDRRFVLLLLLLL
jgi:hypothetical protein